MHHDHDHQAADAVVNALATLTRLLYRLASEPKNELTQASFRRLARSIANAADLDLQELANRSDDDPNGQVPEEIRTALGVLDATANLIGELLVSDADDPTAEGESQRAPTLTLLLSEKAKKEWPDVHADLQVAGVPYSVVDPVDATTGVETLWLPGMRTGLQRTVVRRRGGLQQPVLTWQDHIALTELAAEGISYAALADAYLASDVRDAELGPDTEILGRIADAIAAARGDEDEQQ
jgi:hypothetical protein